ncbi:hypothetical protein DP117_24095 [Brasilonema sp. UFV-L1]|nr:hypothetical protein [Brasilonema sp. UFV-L1]
MWFVNVVCEIEINHVLQSIQSQEQQKISHIIEQCNSFYERFFLGTKLIKQIILDFLIQNS